MYTYGTLCDMTGSALFYLTGYFSKYGHNNIMDLLHIMSLTTPIVHKRLFFTKGASHCNFGTDVYAKAYDESAAARRSTHYHKIQQLRCERYIVTVSCG